MHYATSDGTATEADPDYVGDSGTAQFAPGETTKTVLVKVVGDDAIEGDETFDVILSAPVNATLGNATEVVTIVDNDPIPAGTAVFSIAKAKVREGTSGTVMLTFTVTRSGDMTAAVSVNYASTNGVATAPTDYTVTSGTLAFAAAQTTRTIQVGVNGELALEHDESLFMNLLVPSVGAAISTGQAAGVIVNDDTKTTVGIKDQEGCERLHRERTRVPLPCGQARRGEALPQEERHVGPARQEGGVALREDRRQRRWVFGQSLQDQAPSGQGSAVQSDRDLPRRQPLLDESRRQTLPLLRGSRLERTRRLSCGAPR